jgi:hypothetical protein
VGSEAANVRFGSLADIPRLLLLKLAALVIQLI